MDTLYDHSTYRGKLSAIYSRIPWRVVVAGAVFLALLTGMIVASTRQPASASRTKKLGEVAGDNLNLTSGEYVFVGTGENNVIRGVSMDPASKGKIKHLVIKNAIIDARGLSESLEGATGMETIEIEALDVIGDYERVYLPNLKRFYYNHLHQANSDDFKPADIMKNIVFFDKTRNQDWDFVKDILNLGVNVTVWVDGTVIVDVNRVEGVVNINTHYCQDVLEWGKGSYTKLILSWCKFSNVSVVPPGLRYLNLNNAVPDPDSLGVILKKTRQLEEFHAFQPFVSFDEFAPSYYVTPEDPKFQTPVDISLFPATVTKVSLARLAITASNTATVTAVTDLSLEQTNITSTVLINFAKVFKNLKSLRIFDAQGLPYAKEKNTLGLLLDQTLQTNVTMIVITRFDKELIADYPLVLRQLSYLRLLNSTDFIMQKNNTGNEGIMAWVGRPLTVTEINYKRFEYLKLQDVDTYDDYLLYDSFDAISSGAAKINYTFSYAVTLIVFMFVLVSNNLGSGF